MATIEKTKLGTSYWANDSVNSKMMKALEDKLVPNIGEADTFHGELIRCFGNLNHEFGNNGNGNLIDCRYEDCDTCGGSGYNQEECSSCDGTAYELDEDENEIPCQAMDCEDGWISYDCSECGGECTVVSEYFISEMFEDYVEYLDHNLLNNEPVKKLREFLNDDSLSISSYSFDDEQMKIYNDVGDEVLRTILNTENHKR